jgi:phosphoribosylformimino-5-aminoimidazole carboxamide ribotide isomerase
MRVIPVIDLKDGLVVRGVGGGRADYRPIVSKLAADPRPATVATALVQRFGARQLYVADLNAIAGAEPAWAVYRELAACGVELLVDAGIRAADGARHIAAFAHQHPALVGMIAALECSAGPDQLADVLAVAGPERGWFSLDLKHGRPLIGAASWEGLSAAEIADLAAQIGFRRLIVLDLASVGVDQGPTVLPLCATLRAAYPAIELVAGGGVRGREDLQDLAACGCDAALVASALHDGRLSAADLQALA